MIDLSSDDRLAAFIDVSPIACIVTNPRLPDNPIVAVNAAFVALTGYSFADVQGRNCRMLAGPDSEASARETLREAVAQGKAAVVEMLNYRRDGTAFRNAVMIAPLFDGAGTLAYFLGSQMAVEPGHIIDRRIMAKQQIAGLSRRQLAVLERMSKGMRYARIAKELGINEKTVKMHRGALVAKLGCQTSAEAIRLAIEAGL